MRAVFGVLSLLFVVAVVGFLAKKQLNPSQAVKLPAVTAPADNAATEPGSAPNAAAANVKEQSQQTQAQFKAALESAMQPARAVPDEKP